MWFSTRVVPGAASIPILTARLPDRGLGVAVAPAIVRGHHGAILVDSAPEKGSIFRAETYTKVLWSTPPDSVTIPVE